MVSYAQNGEDVLLNRLFPADKRPGFYIDVGANDPVEHSVTKHFCDHGWRGVNIEPVPAIFRRLLAARPDDVNLNVGLSDREGTLTFYEDVTCGGWSTFSRAQAENTRREGHVLIERTVPVTTLARVGERLGDRPIDFLKIDAESHEREVIAGGDWRRWRPRAVVVECNGWETWEPMLFAADYLFAAFDGINRYYLRAEDRDLLPRLAAPVNALDYFIPYDYSREIDELRARLGQIDSLGPTAVAVGRRLRRLALRFPQTATMVKRLLRKTG